MEYIISRLSQEMAKKILGNRTNAETYLYALGKQLTIDELPSLKGMDGKQIYGLVVKYWDYHRSKEIIRDLFRLTDKYRHGTESAEAIERLRKEWGALGLGPVEWPCSQGDFDGFVQRINALAENGDIKDDKVKAAAVKYRRLKELNTARNDYLETLIFEKNNTIMPTLDHRRGVDFFINGVSFDQKVAKSPTIQFKRDYGDRWKETAKQNPLKVAEYLYRYQDEGRFDADPRLYVVYLDEDIPVIELKKKIDAIDITQPQEITFEYDHEKTGRKRYKTTCFVILLST